MPLTGAAGLGCGCWSPKGRQEEQTAMVDNFHLFAKAVRQRFEEMAQEALFVVDVDPDDGMVINSMKDVISALLYENAFDIDPVYLLRDVSAVSVQKIPFPSRQDI